MRAEEEERDWDEVFGNQSAPDAIRVAICDDARLGNDSWTPMMTAGQVAGRPLAILEPIATTAAEALDLGLRERHTAEIILIDLYVPLGGATASRDQPQERVGVWIAKALSHLWDLQDRRPGNNPARPHMVLFTSNWEASEANHVRAFCELFGGAWALDKQRETPTERVQALRAVVGHPRPEWTPPTPRVRCSAIESETLAYLERDFTIGTIAERFVVARPTIRSRQETLAQKLGVTKTESGKFPVKDMVERAREARMTWIPLLYRDEGFGPLDEFVRGAIVQHAL